MRNALAQIPNTNLGNDRDLATPPRTVQVQILAGGLDDASLMDTVQEVLGRLGVAARPQIASEGDGGVNGGTPNAMTATIDLTSPNEAIVTVRNGRVQIRNAISRDASTSIVREEIADAVRSAVESQLFADEANTRPIPPPIVPVETRVPVIAEAPRPEPERPIAVDLTTFAGAGPVTSSSGFVPHVGGGGVVGSRKGLKPSLSVTGSYVVSFNQSAAGVDATTDIVSLRAAPSIEVLHASWIALAIGVGGGADILSVRASANRPIMALPARTQVDPIVAGRVVAQAGLTPGVAFTLIAGVDVDLASDHYYLEAGANSSDVLVPQHIRPVAEAGFTFTAFGRGLFAAKEPQ